MFGTNKLVKSIVLYQDPDVPCTQLRAWKADARPLPLEEILVTLSEANTSLGNCFAEVLYTDGSQELLLLAFPCHEWYKPIKKRSRWWQRWRWFRERETKP